MPPGLVLITLVVQLQSGRSLEGWGLGGKGCSVGWSFLKGVGYDNCWERESALGFQVLAFVQRCIVCSYVGKISM